MTVHLRGIFGVGIPWSRGFEISEKIVKYIFWPILMMAGYMAFVVTWPLKRWLQ